MDRTETFDLSEQRPENVSELDSGYQRWAAKVGAIPYNDLLERRKQRKGKLEGEQ